MSIVMTGGGTGGHLAIIRAVKEHINDEKLIYIGSTQGQDRQWFEDDDSFTDRYFLETQGVVNQRGLGKLKSLWMLLKATKRARGLLKKHGASVVFSVGGFSSAATAFAAKSLGIPLVIHEQNAAIGSLNKLLKPYAHKFISSYIESSPIKAYPIKNIFFKNAHIRSDIKSIIFIGGSQGAVAINKLALQLAPILDKNGIHIMHQAGERNIESVKSEYEKLGIEADIFGFTTELDRYMDRTDFAIARAGASTLWELSASAIPTLYIPYPYAAADHQYHNAKFLVDGDMAWVMRENEIDIEQIEQILSQSMESRSKKLIDSIEPNGAEQIAKLLEGY